MRQAQQKTRSFSPEQNLRKTCSAYFNKDVWQRKLAQVSETFLTMDAITSPHQKIFETDFSEETIVELLTSVRSFATVAATYRSSETETATFSTTIVIILYY